MPAHPTTCSHVSVNLVGGMCCS